MEALHEIYTTLYGAEVFLSAAECADLSRQTLRFGKHYQAANECARTSGQMYWHIVHKHHWLQHLATQARLINPRFIQAYKEEGLIGRIARVSKSCANGPYSRTIQRTALTKYLVGVQLRYQGFA